MNFFSKTKFLIAVIVVLSAILIAILGTIGYHYVRFEKPDNVKPRENQQPGMYMAKQLKLSPEQIEEFDSLRDNFHADYTDIEKDIKSTSQSIMEEIILENANQQMLDSLANKFGKLQAQQKQLMIDHLLHLKSKCNPKQKANFSKFLRRMEKRENEKGEAMRMRMQERQRNRENREKREK